MLKHRIPNVADGHQGSGVVSGGWGVQSRWWDPLILRLLCHLCHTCLQLLARLQGSWFMKPHCAGRISHFWMQHSLKYYLFALFCKLCINIVVFYLIWVLGNLYRLKFFSKEIVEDWFCLLTGITILMFLPDVEVSFEVCRPQWYSTTSWCTVSSDTIQTAAYCMCRKDLRAAQR